MLWMIKQIRPTQVHLTFTRDILLCSYYYTAVENWCNSLVQNFRSWLMHTKNSPLPRLFKANSVCDTGILSCDVIGILNDCLFTSRPLPLELTGKILDQVLWKILLPRVWIYQLSWLLFTLQTGDMTVVNPLFSDQEVGGSDQDGNGNKSGASGQGSPVMPRHPHKE